MDTHVAPAARQKETFVLELSADLLRLFCQKNSAPIIYHNVSISGFRQTGKKKPKSLKYFQKTRCAVPCLQGQP